jgi:heat shock protein HslJ
MIFLVSLFGLNACVATNTTYPNGSSDNTYQPKPSTTQGFTAERWFLTKINNAPYQGKRITLNISTENKVSGFSGCNRYFVSDIDVSGSRLRLGSVGSTRMMCADYNSNNLEKRYLSALRGVTHFQRSNSRLVLEGREGSLVFYKKSRR